MTRFKLLGGAVFVAAFSAFGASGAFAQAAVMKECGAEWQAAKEAGKVTAGQTWQQFLSDCRVRHQAPANTAAPAAPAPAAAAPAAPAANPLKPAARTTAPAPATPAPTVAGAVFPARVDAKYASLSEGKQRLKTCADQYQANKATNANGGLSWIQKGGGYWSLCNKRLKGE